MNVILLAAPGAGKGTQADLITSNFDFRHLSTGDLLREALLKNDENSVKLKEVMESGKLVSDEIILEIIKNNVFENCNYLFDGFPRTLNQAIMLDELFKQCGRRIDYVINIVVDKDILEKRIVGRVTCPNCKAIYNTYFDDMMPKKEGICDKCGSNLIHRSDDCLETFENRYQTYLDETSPLIDYYKKQGILVEVKSGNTKEETFIKVKKIIEGE